MTRLRNYAGGSWVEATGAESLPLIDPASGESFADVPLSRAEDVDGAVSMARSAFAGWSATPVTERVQYLFRFKMLLEESLEALAETITRECGKTLAEARGELRRGIENVEVACGTPALIQGLNNENIATGIDEHMIRQPLGVVTAITPFNFPGMIPLWFLPYAISCGNCFILKPSEKTPKTAEFFFQLLDRLDLPPGVVNLVHGGAEAARTLVEHPDVAAVSFVGSTPGARSVYLEAARHGKRVQCQGGAKNCVIVLPDADRESTTNIIAESAFGCAGQRCLAASLVIAVDSAADSFTESICDAARSRRVGWGLDPEVEMGPVITAESRERLISAIGECDRSARLIVDGRQVRLQDKYAGGSFLAPSVVGDIPADSSILGTELFGPVLGIMKAANVDEAIRIVNQSRFGNMACLFTSSGAAARQFRNQANAGNIGINIGVAAPMAFFPFSGWNQSFFGDLHAQGRHGIEFYTQTKVVVERW